MRLLPDEIKALTKITGDQIFADPQNSFKVPRPEIYSAIESALKGHFEDERRIEEEAKKLFEEKSEEYTGIQKGAAIGKIMHMLAEEQDFTLSGGREGRMSEDKISTIAHLVADKLYDDDLMDFPDEDDGPKFVKKVFTEYFRKENEIDQKVRAKISSLSSAPFEGSKDWDVLYRKYFQEAKSRMGHGDS